MPQSRPSRRTVLKGAAAAAAASTVGFPAIVGFAKEFSGVTINGASFQHVFFNYLKEYIPEFEEQSGMKVNFNTQAFPVYNQRTDLELSTKGSALDVVNVTFIYTGRWIGAGWVENLDPFVNDPNLTPSDWDASDFVGGAQSSLQDKAGATYGFAWEAGAMIMGMARGDLLDKAGVAVPETFDDLVNVCDKIHNQERVTAFVADKLHHWNWIPYLMGHGGGVFKDPPGNLTPVLDTPEAAKGAEYYANLLTSYGPSGVLSYTDDQAMRRAQLAGRSNIRTQAHRLDDPPRQARGQQGRRDGPLWPHAGGTGRQLPGLQQPRARHPGRVEEQAGGLGVHQVGDEQGDDAADRARKGLLGGLPALGDQRPCLSGEHDPEWPGRRCHLPQGA